MLREIKKKTAVYGALAVLLATILGAVCLNFGIRPLLPPISAGALSTFSSYEELENYLITNQKTPYYYVEMSDLPRMPLPSDVTPSSAYYYELLGLEGADVNTIVPKSGPEYSVTNVQVAGVDEADLVKTDGEYIYVASGNNLTILRAYPAENATILCQISLNGTLRGIFINGDKLAVFGESYFYQPVEAYSVENITVRIDETTTLPPQKLQVSPYHSYYATSSETFVKVYNVSNRVNPSLTNEVTINGTYFNSRMIGDYVYAVTNQPILWHHSRVILPVVISLNETKTIQPNEIYYSSISDNSYAFTTMVSINLKLDESEPVHKTFLLGSASCMYVSLNNIYITMQEQGSFETGWTETTLVHRVHMQDGEIECEASGGVPGRVLNQFSMDEYNNYFRIATTTWVNGNTHNNVYILDTLDMNLSIVGSLTKIAPGEAIDSARFVGSRCYLATSVVQKDPFFVIDVENASDPKILGYLKIPGFTRYLHPYDEDHVIGIGKDGSNVKISLFDVSNVNDPIERDKYPIEGDWSDTPVLTEHKAFLFDKSKQLLALPVSISFIEVKDSWYTKGYWQGAYVFDITLSDGFVLRGNVTHQENAVGEWKSGYWVKRALYIDNVLYTISDKKIKMNNLETLQEINEVKLS